MKILNNVKVAILVANGFEQVEMTKPRQALEAAGAQVDLVSPAPGQVWAYQKDDRGDSFVVDVQLERADFEKYDALVLPGGVANPDRLRMNPQAVQFVRAFFEAGKPIGAICHGPWTLIDADAVRGMTLTSFPSLRADLLNAGARWIDQAVVTYRGLITSRNADDLPAFNAGIIREFAKIEQRVSSPALIG